MTDFFEDLATLCSKELTAGLKSGDSDRVAGVVEGLSTMLGRSIARAAAGNDVQIETLLTGCEAHIASEAVGAGEMIKYLDILRGRRAEQKP